jgi:hypothetical protein
LRQVIILPSPGEMPEQSLSASALQSARGALAAWVDPGSEITASESRTLRKDDAWCKLYYFDDLDHARLFHVMFGGELITQGENGLTKHETRRGLRHRPE